MFIESEGVVPWEAVDELTVLTGKGEGGGAHTIGDHEDDVPLSGGGKLFSPVGVIGVGPGNCNDEP